MQGPDHLYPEVCEVGGFRSRRDVCALRPGGKPEELEKMLFNKSLLWPGPLGRMWLQESNPLSTDFCVCTKQGNRIWMSSLHLLKDLMKTQRCLIPIFTLQETGSGRCLLIKLILKIQTGNLGWGRSCASPLSKGCGFAEFRAFVSSLGVFNTLLPCAFEARGVILFLWFVFYVHHWNVSPEASMRKISNPGQPLQLPEESGKTGRMRNVPPNLWLLCSRKMLYPGQRAPRWSSPHPHPHPKVCIPLPTHIHIHTHAH